MIIIIYIRHIFKVLLFSYVKKFYVKGLNLTKGGKDVQIFHFFFNLKIYNNFSNIHLELIFFY